MTLTADLALRLSEFTGISAYEIGQAALNYPKWTKYMLKMEQKAKKVK
jgi:hypothetical protein